MIPHEKRKRNVPHYPRNSKKDDRIRAVFLNGSRANKNVPTDIYQDYDIVYVVTELESFKGILNGSIVSENV